MNDALPTLESFNAAGVLQSFIAYGIVLACVVLCGLAGLRLKLFQSVIACAAFVAAAVAAFVWCDAAAGLIRGFGGPASWSLVAGYAAVFFLVFLGVKLVVGLVARAEVMTYPAIVDRLGGAAVGAVAGVFLASIIRVGFAMAPVAGAVRPTPEQMQGDITPRVLQMVSRIISSDAAVRRAWLYGESGGGRDGAGPGQIAWSEPFIDENDNGLFDRDEPFLDKDGNGRFTPSVAAADADFNRDLRVGVLERYWLGDWQRVRVMEPNQR